MSKYAVVATQNTIVIVDTLTGNNHVINKMEYKQDDPLFCMAMECIKNKDYERAIEYTSKNIVDNFVKKTEPISHGSGVSFDESSGELIIKHSSGANYPVPVGIINRIRQNISCGLGYEYIIKFVERLVKNPSFTSINQLFLFVEHSNLPITDDGYIIAYKKVRSDYKDIFSGTFDNSIGATVYEERSLVNDDRDIECGRGLHFCSKEYLNHYGSRDKTDRVVIVKIDPADVVSIPRDYNNAKGRCCRYEVVGELTDEVTTDTVEQSVVTLVPESGTNTSKIVSTKSIKKIAEKVAGLLIDEKYTEAAKLIDGYISKSFSFKVIIKGVEIILFGNPCDARMSSPNDRRRAYRNLKKAFDALNK